MCFEWYGMKVEIQIEKQLALDIRDALIAAPAAQFGNVHVEEKMSRVVQ